MMHVFMGNLWGRRGSSNNVSIQLLLLTVISSSSVTGSHVENQRADCLAQLHHLPGSSTERGRNSLAEFPKYNVDCLCAMTLNVLFRADDNVPTVQVDENIRLEMRYRISTSTNWINQTRK